MKSTCLTLTDEEYSYVKDNGLSFIDIFRKGLEAYKGISYDKPMKEPVISYEVKPGKIVKEQPETRPRPESSIYNTYGCGCIKIEGKKLCPRHKVS